ncbi:MAG: SPOR domain-containing protein [Longimicrobiaceae bacterium]
MRAASVCAALAALSAGFIVTQPSQCRAQDGSEARLDRVDLLIQTEDLAAARDTLSLWWQEDAIKVVGNVKARGVYLRALLAESAEEAEHDYLRLAVEHPFSPYADVALLRVGQYHLARGESAEAGFFLNRLYRDYPNSPIRPLGSLWLGRVRLAAGEESDGCDLVLAAYQAGENQELRQAAAESWVAGCGSVQALGPEAAELLPSGDGGSPPEPDDSPPAEEVDGEEGEALFTVQVAALASLERAEMLREELREVGEDAFLARVEGSSLTRVRVGGFSDRDTALRAAARLQELGYGALVVRIVD